MVFLQVSRLFCGLESTNGTSGRTCWRAGVLSNALNTVSGMADQASPEITDTFKQAWNVSNQAMHLGSQVSTDRELAHNGLPCTRYKCVTQ